jgi:spheroidene monooxygenase
MDPISTITLLKYKGFSNQFWALQMMQSAKPHLKNVEGLSFYKLLGSGQDGFKPQPDWSVYALLQVWESEKNAVDFFEKNPLIDKYKKHSTNITKLYLKPITAHGLWSGKQPFKFKDGSYDESKPVAIITRASIKTSQLIRFWNYVPQTQRAIEKAKGLLYTKGFGEFPIWEMATFSLWQNMEFAQKYAYRNKEHRKAISMTKQYNWYKEELFSRFQVYKVDGNWMGKFDELSV